MNDSDSLFDIQRQIANCKEIIEWKVFWTYYDEVMQTCVNGTEKTISIIDLCISILQKVKLTERCVFESIECKMEKILISTLNSILLEKDFVTYSSRLLDLMDLYYHSFWLPISFIDMLHSMYLTDIQWIQKQNTPVSVAFTTVLFEFRDDY